MTFQWWRRGASRELRSLDGRVWAVITRRAPFYRIRLFGGPSSQSKRTATMRQAMDVAEAWVEQRKA